MNDPAKLDGREKDVRWVIHPDKNGIFNFDAAILAVLMDIRDELKRLNDLIYVQDRDAVLPFEPPRERDRST